MMRKLWPIYPVHGGQYVLKHCASCEHDLNCNERFCLFDRTVDTNMKNIAVQGHRISDSYRGVQQMDALSTPTKGTYRKISATQDVLAEDLANILPIRKGTHQKVGK